MSVGTSYASRKSSKMRGPAPVIKEQKNFELKHRVLVALNKIADRDTYQLGVEELNKVVECMTAEGVIPFLSCILDTDSEQKSAVRKECVRLIGTLASLKGDYIAGSNLGRMVASIVRRLKDQDSTVRDACLETMGVLASKFGNPDSQSSNDGVFVVLVKPFFEALGEQNRQVQSGSALCLARVIDNTRGPPISLLQRMLTRTTNLLNNSHFLAKPAVIELSRSIIQAGGAQSVDVLSAAISSIQAGLKNSDWNTRKAASEALGNIAAGSDNFLRQFRASTISALESCRYDKVKPVRDTVVQALNFWRSILGSDTSEPSETGSSIKENSCCNYNDLRKATDIGRKNVSFKRDARTTMSSLVSMPDRKACHVCPHSPPVCKADDWQIEVAVPKNCNASLSDIDIAESECGSFSKAVQEMSGDVSSSIHTGYEFVPMDDKQECSSVSNDDAIPYEEKFASGGDSLIKSLESNQFGGQEIISREQIYSTKVRDCRSIDSTLTESSSQTSHGCCLQTINEMASIRKQLLEIENSQSNLMKMLQVFISNTNDSLSMIQSKVASLECVVDRISYDIVQEGGYSASGNSKFSKKSESYISPRLSTCTPRPSVDFQNKLTPRISTEIGGTWREKTSGRSRLSNSSKMDLDISNESIGKITSSYPYEKSNQETAAWQNMNSYQKRKLDSSVSAAPTTVTQKDPGNKSGLWKRVMFFLFEGDLDSAYTEALCSADEVVLTKLLYRTGPALDRLTKKTACELLTTLASYFLEQRYLKTVIPWLLQLVELSTIYGSNYLVLSAKVRREFLLALEEVVNEELSNSSERKCIRQLGIKLHQIWGVCS